MDDLSTFAKRMQYVADLVGGQAELARRASKISGMKITTQAVQYLCADKNNATGSAHTPFFAKAVGMSASFLGNGELPMWVGEPFVKGAAEPPATNAINDENYATIRNYDVAAAAGTSSVVEHEVVKNTLAYRRDWLNEQKLIAEQCVVIGVKGDSMAPTIKDGDSILVDTADKRIVSDRIYAIQYDEGPRVKRLIRQLDKSIVMRSDNPDRAQYRDEPLRKGMDAAIIGRVVHRSGLV